MAAPLEKEIPNLETIIFSGYVSISEHPRSKSNKQVGKEPWTIL